MIRTIAFISGINYSRHTLGVRERRLMTGLFKLFQVFTIVLIILTCMQEPLWGFVELVFGLQLSV